MLYEDNLQKSRSFALLPYLCFNSYKYFNAKKTWGCLSRI